MHLNNMKPKMSHTLSATSLHELNFAGFEMKFVLPFETVIWGKKYCNQDYQGEKRGCPIPSFF